MAYLDLTKISTQTALRLGTALLQTMAEGTEHWEFEESAIEFNGYIDVGMDTMDELREAL